MEKLEDIKNLSEPSVVVANQEGIIIYTNEYFSKVFLWSKQEILGLPLTVIIPDKLHTAHNMGFSKYIATEKSNILTKPLDLPAVTKDGKEFSAKHQIFAFKENDEFIFAATIG